MKSNFVVFLLGFGVITNVFAECGPPVNTDPAFNTLKDKLIGIATIEKKILTNYQDCLNNAINTTMIQLCIGNKRTQKEEFKNSLKTTVVQPTEK
jgi:hypothetical protein